LLWNPAESGDQRQPRFVPQGGKSLRLQEEALR